LTVTTFYKLKDFARITNLSRKTLLLYEQNGILEPEKVDEKTSYRYYSSTQIRKASMLSLLRNFEVPIKDLKSIFDGSISIASYFEQSKKRVEYVRYLNKIQNSLQILSQCEKNNSMFSSEPEVCVLPKKAVLFSEVWGTIKDIQLHFALIFRYMQQYGIAASDSSFTWYFQDSTRYRLHVKTCCPVTAIFETGNKEIKCELFPDVKVARLRHFGSYATLHQTYSLLDKLLTEKDWKKSGEYLETYIVTGDPRYCDSSTFVTEVAGVLV